MKVAKGGAAEARELAEKILGMQLVTHQTGPEGQKVPAPLHRAGARHRARALPRAARRPRHAPHRDHGVDRRRHGHREGRARARPRRSSRVHVDPVLGLAAYQARELAFALGLDKDEGRASSSRCSRALYECFVEEDCSLFEINPLVVTKQGDVVALDAQDQLRRQRRVPPPRVGRAPRQRRGGSGRARGQAARASRYVSLDGNIGCLVNGAGLAMATMDIIKHYGGSPANFLDVGGGATQEQVTKAFQMILRSRKVKGIFVNIFGGIMRCDVIAAGVVAATKELGLKVPLVVRLEGTNVELGRKILDESGLAIQAGRRRWPTARRRSSPRSAKREAKP